MFNRGRVYWFTGQPGSGKTTLAGQLHKTLQYSSMNLIWIDGDNLRELTKNFDYTQTGREKNIGDAQMLARFLYHNGFVVIVSLVAPYRKIRENFKRELGKGIVEIYTHGNVDPEKKGYYAPDYEVPIGDCISLDTSNKSPTESFQELMSQIDLY